MAGHTLKIAQYFLLYVEYIIRKRPKSEASSIKNILLLCTYLLVSNNCIISNHIVIN